MRELVSEHLLNVGWVEAPDGLSELAICQNSFPTLGVLYRMHSKQGQKLVESVEWLQGEVELVHSLCSPFPIMLPVLSCAGTAGQQDNKQIACLCPEMSKFRQNL